MRSRPYLSLLVGYTVAILFLATLVSIANAGRRNPHEFDTPLHAFFFGMFVSALLLFIGSGVPFAVLSFGLRNSRMPSTVALIVGASAGAAVFVIAATGIGKRIANAVGISGLAQLVVPGVIVGIVLLVLVALLSCMSRSQSRNERALLRSDR